MTNVGVLRCGRGLVSWVLVLLLSVGWLADRYDVSRLIRNSKQKQEVLPSQGSPSVGLGNVTEYRTTFDSGPEGWQSYGNGPNIGIRHSPSGGQSGGYIYSQGTWWLDPNHAPPEGAGFLNMPAFVKSKDVLGERTGRQADFRDALLTVWLRGIDVELKGSHLVFWVQGKDTRTGKHVNYVLRAQPLDSALLDGHWHKATLKLTTDPGQWTCLGTSPARRDYYGCAPIEDVLRKVDDGFGFVLFPVTPRFLESDAPVEITEPVMNLLPIDPASLPSGTIAIDEFTLAFRQ